jgi:hypothetical protein
MERNFNRRERVNPRRIARAAMFWLRDPSEQPAEQEGARNKDGYIVRNDSDWPERICGTLSLRDVFEVAKGVRELGIAPSATVETYKDSE